MIDTPESTSTTKESTMYSRRTGAALLVILAVLPPLIVIVASIPYGIVAVVSFTPVAITFYLFLLGFIGPVLIRGDRYITYLEGEMAEKAKILNRRSERLLALESEGIYVKDFDYASLRFDYDIDRLHLWIAKKIPKPRAQ